MSPSLPPTVSPAPPASPALVAELEALDGRRAAATIAKDRGTLADLLAPELRYVHSSGTDENRDTYLERVCGGYYDYRALTTLRRDWRVHGAVALCNGDVRIEVIVQGKPKTIHSRYLQVWVRNAAGAWQMASWQSTPMAV